VTRIIGFIVFVALIALGVTWVADQPGELVLTLGHWQISRSPAEAAVSFIILLVVAMLLWTGVRFVMRSPDLVALFFRERKKARGWRAITQGMIAVGTGDLAIAKRSAGEARKHLGEEPLALLLAAQAAQLGGEAEKAEAEFRTMLGRVETKLLGLRGLYMEAVRRNDAHSARAYAEEAARGHKMPAWAAEALIEFQGRARDWRGALATLERAVAASAVGRAVAARRRAVLLTAQALSLEETDPTRARDLSVEAAKLAPDLVPAAALAGRLLGAHGSLRKAAKVIEKAWAAVPHPDLAQAYAHLQPGASAEDRLQRLRKLVKKTRDEIESTFAMARGALEARRFEEARAALVPLLGDPTQRACLLMAEIEAVEHGDHGKAREWALRAMRAKRDPAWVADGVVTDEWMPASPQTGKLDAFKWSAPPTIKDGPVLEQVAEQALAVMPMRHEHREHRQKPLFAPAERARPVETNRAASANPAKVAPLVAEPPLPDDPGPADETEEEAPPKKRFRFLDWLAGPAA
jgi:HemY protein